MSYVNKLWAPDELAKIHDAVNAYIRDELQHPDTQIDKAWVCRELSNQISVYEQGLSLINFPRETHINYVRQRTIDQIKHDVFHYFLSAQKYKTQITEGVDSSVPNPVQTRSVERRAMNEGLPALIVSRPEIFCDEPPRGQVLQLALGSDAVIASDPNVSVPPFRRPLN